MAVQRNLRRKTDKKVLDGVSGLGLRLEAFGFGVYSGFKAKVLRNIP